MALKLSLKRLFGGYAPVFGFALLVAALVVVHAGSILNYGFPLLATALGFFLFVMARPVYVAFVWWTWLFSPLVRRLVDYQSSYHSISPVLLAPLLVTSIALIPLLRNPRFILKRSLSPFLLLLLVYLYALIFGAIANGIVPAAYDFVNSVVPLGFGLFLVGDYKWSTENRDAFLFSVTLGLLLIALYGLYQFYHMPPWDAYWLKAANFNSAGLAIAQQIRLFGPLNSPGPYGTVLMVSLTFILVSKGPLRIFAGGFGFPAFGLSLVRASWLGWAFSTVFIMLCSGGKTRLRLILIGTVLVLIALPMVTVGPVADALSKRFATFNNIQQDGSYQARRRLYEDFTVDALSTPTGIGFGGNGLSTKLGGSVTAGFDSGLLQIPYQFGWGFGSLFVWAIFTIALRVIGAARKTSDSIGIAGAGIYLALVLENVGAPTWSGVVGMGAWIGAALAWPPITAAVPRKPGLNSGITRQLAVSGVVRES